MFPLAYSRRLEGEGFDDKGICKGLINSYFEMARQQSFSKFLKDCRIFNTLKFIFKGFESFFNKKSGTNAMVPLSDSWFDVPC